MEFLLAQELVEADVIVVVACDKVLMAGLLGLPILRLTQFPAKPPAVNLGPLAWEVP
jgi:hypothetical protein